MGCGTDLALMSTENEAKFQQNVSLKPHNVKFFIEKTDKIELFFHLYYKVIFYNVGGPY